MNCVSVSNEIVNELMNVVNKYMLSEGVNYLERELGDYASEVRNKHEDLIYATYYVAAIDVINNTAHGYFEFQFADEKAQFCVFEI